MNAVESLFSGLRATKRAAFIPFVPAGDPDLAFTRELLTALPGCGADLIEVGVPFSDPIADGPVIQASYTRALAAGFKLRGLYETCAAVTQSPGYATPLVAMASYSLVWKRGPAQFITDCLMHGIAGAVVPDLPIEEAENLSKLSRNHNFALTLLVTPTTSPERAERAARACTGFVYVVSLVGITGEAAKLSDSLAEMLGDLRNLTDRPLCVGFGVSRPEQVAWLGQLCDGVIVGSALAKLMAPAADPAGRAAALAGVTRLATELSAPLRSE